MKVFQINAVPYGSTGKIMFQISDIIEQSGGLCYTAASFTKDRGIAFPQHYIQIGTAFGKLFHILFARVTGHAGTYSKAATRNLIRQVKAVDPDIIHLHILHSWYINLPLLFAYLKKSGKKVVWTFHDCWAFTGHCANFEMVQCEKWQTQCRNCPQFQTYPECWKDDSVYQYRMKRRLFTDVPEMTIVAPSEWMKRNVERSFLSSYPVYVIRNGIDLQVFRPTAGTFREKHHWENKKILLGVAYAWTDKKGLDVFIELAERLPECFQIILVGTDEKVDRRLPENILSVHRTENVQELAEIYSTADIFVNPTREDNFPTVNLEALACGLPVVTFQTGGSPECVDGKTGCVVPKNDVEAMFQAILRIVREQPYKRQDCVERARMFDKSKCGEKYLTLYRCLLQQGVEKTEPVVELAI